MGILSMYWLIPRSCTPNLDPYYKPGKAKNGPSPWTAHVEAPDNTGSWFWPGPATAIAVVLAVNQYMEDLSVSSLLSVYNSSFQINKINVLK